MVGRVQLATPVSCPDNWVIVSRWLARCVVRGQLVVRYSSDVVADVVSVAKCTPHDLANAVVGIYDRRLVAVFQRLAPPSR